MSSPDWMRAALEELAAEGLLRHRRVMHLLPHGVCATDSGRIVDFASNDYLDLARDPRVAKAAAEAISASGVGARASALVCGRTQWHEQLERQIALFENEPDALLFPTGMAANMGTISSLCGADDLILCDRFNHASLIDGCRLSRAKVRIYRHDDLPTLERELSKVAGSRRRWIVTDSVFSMEGDLAPLPELCDLAERYSAELIVDEAHATGVFGPQGRGACEAMAVEKRVAVRIGTLSKAIGTQGGFVAGSSDLISFLWNKARTQIYSTALSPAICAAAAEAIRILIAEPERRARLLAASQFFRDHLRQLGIPTFPQANGPIVPIVLRDPKAAVALAARLETRGFLVGAIRPPTVPRGTSRLRIVVTCAHQDETLVRLATTIRDEAAAMKIGFNEN